jgi:hypothetical protein
MHATSRAQAEAAIKAAGYRVGRHEFMPEHGFGYVFSYECDRACYGHPMMEVRYTPDPRPFVSEAGETGRMTGRPLRVQVRPVHASDDTTQAPVKSST